MGQKILRYDELRVYEGALEAATRIYELSKGFLAEEKFSLTDQIQRSSRSVCANIAEAWRKRRYPAAFIAKLNDAEGESDETQAWLDVAERCGYLKQEIVALTKLQYDQIVRQLVSMGKNPENWVP
jgi:four helix bundle protein